MASDTPIQPRCFGSKGPLDLDLTPFADQIPPNSGKAPVMTSRFESMLHMHKMIAVAAAALLFVPIDPRVQYVGLGLLFPGGAFLALGGHWLLAFMAVVLIFGASLFIWFATGNIVALFFTWPGLSLVVPFFLREPVISRGAYTLPVLIALAYLWLPHHTAATYKLGREKRNKRNAFLPGAVAKIQSIRASSNVNNHPELGVEELGQLRFLLQVGFQDKHDWSHFNVIDQFQTASLRYQLAELVYTLATINKLYTPSFRGGYMAETQKNLLYKYCQQKVLSYWKWETLWGKLSTDYEPTGSDNVMMTGLLLLAVSLYESATGDTTFSQEGALNLVIDKKHHYPHSSGTLAKAILSNFDQSPCCLYACEPTWVYSFCNLHGANGLALHDCNNGERSFERVKEQFKKGLIEEFSNIDGSGVAIRNALMGFTIPGLVGASNDFSLAALTSAIFPDISLRTYAIAREEYIEFDDSGKISFKGLQGVDRLDLGNYKPSLGVLYATSLLSSKELGDQTVSTAVTNLIDQDVRLGRRELDGVVWYSKLSLSVKAHLLRGRILQRGFWKRAVTEPVSDAVKNGPYLCTAKYPEVLVAKAISHMGTDLELVLYPGSYKRQVHLGLKQLTSNNSYTINRQMGFTANEKGEAIIEVDLVGRTHLKICPV